MRVLFTFAGGSGHLEPLLPFARAAAAAGHGVAFAGRPWMTPRVEEQGFCAFATGSDVGLRPTRRPLARVDLEREMRAVGVGFGGRIARERAKDILALCTAWKPDLLVCEEFDFGAMLVAERFELPHATVPVSATGAFIRAELVADPLDAVRAEHGLPPDPSLEAVNRWLVLSLVPPSYRDPDVPRPRTAHAFRTRSSGPGAGTGERSWRARRGTRPTVYVTLGTVFNVESGDLFDRILAGLRDLPIELIVTVGRDMDPAAFGRQPAGVRIERYVPQDVVLPRCRAVVSHGGSGSVMGALAHGLPLVLLPMGADQPLNAARCEALGVARNLDALEATPGMLREALTEVLRDPNPRRAAERIRDEIAALPDAAHAVTRLEQLATDKRPLYAV